LNAAIFFRREVEDEETIDAGLCRLALKLGHSMTQDGIEVGVENNRDLRAPANFADASQHTVHRRAALKRALRRQLIDNAIRQRIGKWNAQLQQVGSRFLQDKRDFNGPGKIWITRANVWNEGGTIFVAALSKKTFDSFRHRWHS